MDLVWLMGEGIEIGLVCHDEEIVRLAAEIIAASNFGSLHLLQFESCGGELSVTGAVESFYEKQIALSYCRSVPGVVAVIDQIDVYDAPTDKTGSLNQPKSRFENLASR